jgi:hypothetical protein
MTKETPTMMVRSVGFNPPVNGRPSSMIRFV